MYEEYPYLFFFFFSSPLIRSFSPPRSGPEHTCKNPHLNIRLKEEPYRTGPRTIQKFKKVSTLKSRAKAICNITVQDDC